MTDILPFRRPTPRRIASAAPVDSPPFAGGLHIRARDLDASRRFYAAAAGPLGLDILEAREDGFTLGGDGRPTLVVAADIVLEDEFDAQPQTRPAHLAIEAPDGFSVRAFYRAALEAGGRRAGSPGPQPMDGPGSYYAAKVIDPDGNCIECGWRH